MVKTGRQGGFEPVYTGKLSMGFGCQVEPLRRPGNKSQIVASRVPTPNNNAAGQGEVNGRCRLPPAGRSKQSNRGQHGDGQTGKAKGAQGSRTAVNGNDDARGKPPQKEGEQDRA